MHVDATGETIHADAGVVEGRQLVGDRYELLGLLGAGGMGNVYKARDRELDELVALKVLRPELVAAPGAIERFRREVKLARRVTHRNVARVFDIGEHGGDRILTMELVDGESLATLIHREGASTAARAVDIARAICAGVGAAHDAGVIHRDLKPDNVLLARDGRVVVTDFGIARAAAEGARTVGIVGTPAYMAPEQLEERTPVDGRADIYAFGAMLFELLVGEPAWQADSLWALAAARLLKPPPDPHQKRPDLHAPLAELVTRCMARDPASRPASMREIESALATMTVSDAPPPVKPASVAPPAMRATTGTDRRVAVLPFVNLGSADEHYVADGLTEDLIDALSVARGLRVRSRGAAMAYKGPNRDARDVGRELDVEVVVEGSVRRVGDRYRISARVVSVSEGFQLWARRFEASESELLARNDDIARAVADALTADLALPERRVASDGRAVDLYLRAKDAFHRMFSVRTGDARKLFEELVSLTPDDPRALAGLAVAIAHEEWWDPKSRTTAYESADRAVALAPTLADGHYARGAVRAFDGDFLGAVAPLRRALRLSPQHAEAHEGLGRILGDIDDDACPAHLELARSLEPAFEFSYIALAMFHALRGDRSRADEILEAAERLPGLGILIAPRIALWTRDVELARAIRARLDMSNPLHALSDAWLAVLLDGTLPRPPELPAPPGKIRPKFLDSFFLEVTAELAFAAGVIPVGLDAMKSLDALGTCHTAWIERCSALESFRALPDAAELRRRAHNRAAKVAAAYRSPDQSLAP